MVKTISITNDKLREIYNDYTNDFFILDQPLQNVLKKKIEKDLGLSILNDNMCRVDDISRFLLTKIKYEL